MYHSKRIGGDRIDVYKPAMRARKTDRLTLESELRRAIERQEITILYQPIVRLEDRSIAGFEALARWDHPKLGRMSPSEFISIAEEIGLIVDLGMFVLDQTARQLSIWQRAMRSREPIFASRQRLLAAIAAPRPDPRYPHRAVALLGGARHAEAGTDGIAGHGEPGARGADADAHPRTRHRAVARRFRHRPFLAGLSAALPVRHHQDRPVLRAHHQPRHAAGDPEIDHRARPRPRHGRGRGRRGDRIRMRSSSISWAANTRRALPSASRWTPTPRCGCSRKNDSKRRANVR